MNPILLLYSLCSTLALQTSFAKCLSALGPIAILGHSQAPWYGQVQGDIQHFQKKPTNVFYLSSQVLLIISNIENYFLDLIPFTKMNYYIPLVTLNSLSLRRCSSNFKSIILTWFMELISWVLLRKLISGEHHITLWWYVETDLGNGLVLSGKKPLPEPRASSFRQGMVYTVVSTGINCPGCPIHAHDAHEGRRPKVDWWGRNGASQPISLIWVLHFSKNLSFSDSWGDSCRYQ